MPISFLLKAGLLLVSALAISGGIVATNLILSTNTTNMSITEIVNATQNVTATNITNETLQQPITGDLIHDLFYVWETSPNFVPSLIEMLIDGVSGVGRLFAKIFNVLATYIMRYLTGSQIIIAPWFLGYVFLMITMAVLFFTQWQGIWGWVFHNFMWAIILLSSIFILGVTLGFLGLV